MSERRDGGLVPAVLGGAAALAAAAAAGWLTALSGGAVRLDVVVLATLLRELRSVPLRVACVLVAAAAVLLTLPPTAHLGILLGIAVLESLATALVIQRVPGRAGGAAVPGHRFAVTAVWLAGVATVGALAQSVVIASTGPTLSDIVLGRLLALGVGVFLAAAVGSRATFGTTGQPLMTKLAGASMVVALTLAGLQTVLGYWATDDRQTLSTAADTTAASFQQSVAVDVDAFLARANTPPRFPWTSEDIFTAALQPYVQGNASVNAFALVQGSAGRYRVLYATTKQGAAPALAPLMGGSPRDAAAFDQLASTGGFQLLGSRPIPGPDAVPQESLVYAAPQAVNEQGQEPLFLTVAVSLPVAFGEGVATLGPLQQQVALSLRSVGGDGATRTISSAVPEGVLVDDGHQVVSEATFGDLTYEVVADATNVLGVPMTRRVAVSLAILAFGLLALFLVLQASNARYRSQRELEEREALLAVVLAGAPGTVLLVDGTRHVLMTNRAVGELPASQRLGEALPFAYADHAAAVDDVVSEALAGRSSGAEVVDMSGGEALRIFTVSANPVAGPRPRAVVQVQEVTEQRAQAVRGAQAQRLQALGTMAGGLAHDFNNLLFIITGYLQMLQEDDRVLAHQDLVRYVDRAVDAAGRGTEIASSLLAVSRSQPLQATHVEVGEFVRGMMPLVRQAVGNQRDVRLVVDDGAHDVLVDSGQLSSAVLNLVINSRDATEPGGTVDVLVERRTVAEADLGLPPGQYVAVEVRDDGTGMTPEVGARAFEPFFSTKSTGNGTGLGLTAVYSFAAQSGGIASITTEPGRGTSVVMLLPLHEEPVAEQADGAPVVDDGQRRVLVVDDEAALAGLVATWVADTGADVRVASSPAEAMAEARLLRPHVLLTDIRLGDPELDGIGLSARLVEADPALAVILMTGFSDRMADAQAIGTRVLAKPFTKDELVAALAALEPATQGAGS